MNALVIVQARMGSTRLPGKVNMAIEDQTCLYHVMSRVALAGLPYILTIPRGPEDDVLAEVAATYDWPVSRGPHPNLTAAFLQAHQDAKVTADIIVRVTADCPFVQPRAIVEYAEKADRFYHYVSNAHPVRLVPKGLDVEAFTLIELYTANDFGSEEDRHHVTPYIRRMSDLGTDTSNGEFRVTLDTAEDLAVLRQIAQSMDCTPPRPTLAELQAYFIDQQAPGTHYTLRLH